MEERKTTSSPLEVMVLLDTLRTINNPLQDYPLVALLKSAMFEFDEDQLARLALQELKARRQRISMRNCNTP